MSFADFLIEVPAWFRLVLCILLYVGFSVLATHVFHHRALLIAQEDDDEESSDEETPEAGEATDAAPKADKPRKLSIPPGYNLSGRGIQFLNVAFVFLLVFTIGQFWSNQRMADHANAQESTAFAKAGILAEELPEGAQRDAILGSLAAYRANVLDEQWPALQRADVKTAYTLEAQAGRDLITGLRVATTASTENAAILDEISSSMDDITSNGVDRITALPGSEAPRVLWLIFVLSIVNLGLVIAYQPARRPLNLFVVGLMGAITGMLMFVVVEVSNPYLPGGITSLMTLLP